MKITTVIIVGMMVVASLSGCAVKMVDGSTVQLAATGETDNRFYQGVYTGCIQTLVMQNRGRSLMQPDLPNQIARQCMVIAAMAVKSETHTIVIPGWPGLDSIREIIEELEDGKVDPNMASF